MEFRKIKKLITRSLKVIIIGLSLFPLAAPLIADSANSITVVVPTEPDTLDMTISTMAPVSDPIGGNVVERLVALDTKGNLMPGLATFKLSPDGKKISFTLRKGITFTSGDPLTTKDVIWSHERAMKAPSSYARTNRMVKNFEVIDDYHFNVYFKAPDVAYFGNRPLPIASKSYFDRVGEEEFVKNPVGTGPYKLAAWKRGEYIDLVANEDYWGEKPLIKKARFLFVKEDTTRVSLLKSGEVDMILATPFTLVKQVEAEGYKTVRVPVHPSCSVQFKTNNPDSPWYNRKVRLAIAHAIDGDNIVAKLFQGVPARYARFAPWEVGYDPDLKPYTYDPKLAKQLLAEAGYPNGFEMPLYYFAGRATGQKETVEAVSLFLNAIGIRTKVEGIEPVQLLAKVRKFHSDPKAVFVGVTTVPMAHYFSSTQVLDIAYTSKSILSLYYNPAYDELVNRAKATMDINERAKIIKQAVRIMHDDVATVPIWANISVYAMKHNIDYTPTIKIGYPMVYLKDIQIRK